MKTLTFIVFILIIQLDVDAQGFVDLNFENATIVQDTSSPYYPYAVYANDAIPGWTAMGYLSPQDIVYNTQSTGASSVALFSIYGSMPAGALDGAYSIDLYGGGTTGASISQTGLVPGNAASIQFIAQGEGQLSVSLGGQNISFSPLSAGSGYTVYGGNIPSGLAGNSEQLVFLAPEGLNIWELDDIQFSPIAAPEPGVIGLLGMGGLIFGLCRWKNVA